MKLYTLILLSLFASLFLIDARRVHSRHRRHLKSRGPSDNILYQFLMGTLAVFSGQPSVIDECSKLIPGWESVGITEKANSDKKDKGSADNNLKEQTPTWKKILGYLGTAINIVCSVKDKIIDFFTKRRRRWMRLFVQGKVHRRFRWSFSGFLDKAKDTIKSAATSIASGVSKVKNAVVDGVDWAKKKADEVTSFIVEKIKEKFQPIFDFIDDVKDKFNIWLTKHPFIAKAIDFLKCFLTNKGVAAIKTLISGIQSLVTLIASLGTPAGWVKLIVNLVCGWESLKEGIEFLIQGIDQTDALKKFNFYGKFFGGILKALAG